MVEVSITCNKRGCNNDVEEHFYCEECFNEMLDDAREEGRDQAEK